MDVEKKAPKEPAKTRKMEAETTRSQRQVDKELEVLKRIVKKGKESQISRPWFNSGDSNDVEHEGPLLLGKRRTVSYADYKEVLEFYEELTPKQKQCHKMNSILEEARGYEERMSVGEIEKIKMFVSSIGLTRKVEGSCQR